MKINNPIEEYYQLKLKLELTDSEKKLFNNKNDKYKNMTIKDIKYQRFKEFYKKWITYKDDQPYKKAKKYS